MKRHLDFPPLAAAPFLSRRNRFAGAVQLDGREVVAHVPSSGRLGELLYAGNPVSVADGCRPDRRTTCDLVLARGPNSLVCVDTRVTNRLAALEPAPHRSC